ncbi:DUF222 domain-containing protein [Candidatus Poriferisodalis sp.]|uniref:HNH endonuclease signature motif containing protein n=1 Tax=Candidatus Poriferisodalis sp. TaxID=3101277 RepID=UPI003C6F9CDB
MFSQVRQALDSLAAALDRVDAAPTGELRDALGLAKPLRAKLETLETAVASQIARRERHGDGGAGMLHQIAAVPRSDAARNVRTAAELEQMPAAQSALTQGEMCMANAARLARAARDTSPEAVQGDAELVNLAKTLPPDEFAHASKRWTAQHQSAADLAARHRRNRRNRNVRFWNGDDGTVQMRGSFDAEMGARIQARVRAEAERLRQADRRLKRTRPAASPDDSALHDAARSSSTGDGAVRTRDQRMADALDRILAQAAPTPATARDTASGDTAAGDMMPGSTASGGGHAASNGTASGGAVSGGAGSVGHKGPSTEIIVRADLGDLLDECGGMGEIAGAGPVPASVIDRLSCNADISVVLFGKPLTPLYETAAGRAPTAAQRRALIARDGGCIGCGAVPSDCEAHHIVPWRCGGATRVDNLVLVCWSCHDRIHDHNWQVVVRDGRYRLVVPDAASLPNSAPSRKPALFP